MSERGRLLARDFSRFWMLSTCTRQSRCVFRSGNWRSNVRSWWSSPDQAQEFLGPVEGEDLPAAGVRLQGVGELGDLAGGLVGERQGQDVVQGGGNGLPRAGRSGYPL